MFSFLFKKKIKSVSRNTRKVKRRKVTAKNTKAIVNTRLLNARQEPELKAKVAYQMKKNALVNIIETYDEWYKIEYKGEIAYSVKKYFNLIDSTQKGRITANILNVRNYPSTESYVAGKLEKGDIINIIKNGTSWHLIEFDNKAAYVYGKFVDLLDNNGDTTHIDKTEYFYQRNDLKNIKLKPEKQLTQDVSGKRSIAAKTWNQYGNLITVISKELKIEVESALAVLCVESGGKGFSNQRMIIRFENHIFYKYWGDENEDVFEDHFKFNRKKTREDHFFRNKKRDDWEKCHTSQDIEWKVFEFARSLSEKHALYSISMGAPQIMGFNYKSIGYESPLQMFEYFNKDIRYHLLALFDFCKYREQRIKYLQDKDFYSFSREYNGTAAPAAYEKRIKEYYDIFKEIL